MNYQRIHDQIINRAQMRNDLIGYTEKHHIIPKSMGGDNSTSNLVKLTAREHYLVHWLLYKIHKNYKMADAWWMMTSSSSSNKHRRYTSHTFKYSREAAAKSSGDRMKGVDHTGTKNPMFGKKHSDKTKSLMSNNMKGPNSHRYGKPGANKGITLSEATKLKMCIAAAKRIKCLYCDFISRPASISRYHNENCKYKYNIIEEKLC